MPNLNQVNLIGHLAADPQVKISHGGMEWCSFSLAISSGSGEKKQTTYLDVKAFGFSAQALKFANKGDAVMVEGRLQKESWDDRNTGQKRYNTVVIANHALLIAKTWGEQARREEDRQEEQQGELPF